MSRHKIGDIGAAQPSIRRAIFNTLVVRVFSAQILEVFDQGIAYGIRVVASTDTEESSMKRRGCTAVQMSDNMVCRRCGVQWDVKDEQAPACQPDGAPRRQASAPEVAERKTGQAYAAFKNNLTLLKQRMAGGVK